MFPPRPVLAVGLVLATVLVYFPGLGGGYAFDDFHVIVANASLAPAHWTLETLLDAAFGHPTGPLGRPLALLSFALERSLFGLDPFVGKAVNLGLHGLNALLLAWLATRLVPHLGLPPTVQAAHFGLAVALLWALHPVAVSSVLYVVQRMTTLSATLVLVALVCWWQARTHGLGGRTGRAWLAAAVVAAVLAPLVKETALLLPVYVLVIEMTVARPRTLRRFGWLFLPGLFALFALLAWLAPPALQDAYRGRDFSPAERLWTEARVVLDYLRLLVLPQPAAFALFHDDLVLSRGWSAPPTTLPAVAVVFLLGALGGLLRWPWLAFGCAWFLGGHLLESTLVPLEPMHEHRNYLPSFGILLALSAAVARLSGTLGQARVAVLFGAALVCAGLTAGRAAEWRDPLQQMALEARRHPDSVRAHYEHGRLLLGSGDEQRWRRGRAALERAAALAPTAALPVAALFRLDLLAPEVPTPDERTALFARLRALPWPSLQVEVLADLVRCQAYEKCRADPAMTLEVAALLLARAGPGNPQHGVVLEWLGVYYLRVLGDRDAGLAVLADAVAAAPHNAGLALRRAEALRAAGRNGEAARVAAAVVLPWHAPLSRRQLWQRRRDLLGP